ncbi:MAG TPA: DinB family protein [Thermoanaerobaculia bacterium]|jgi:uncharacterized damage-inducible protein DinB|nr:DinB family protein [Thermoanaerobaculia bacterium]
MNRPALVAMFQFSHGALGRNLEGITHEESLRAPESGGNSLNWVLGHLLYYRNRILSLLGAPPAWDSPQAARYARGSAPLGPDDDPVPLETLRAGFDRSQELLLAALAAISEEELAAVNERGEPVIQRLALLGMHEAYHGGQIGLLRRLTGHSGAIA